MAYVIVVAVLPLHLLLVVVHQLHHLLESLVLHRHARSLTLPPSREPPRAGAPSPPADSSPRPRNTHRAAAGCSSREASHTPPPRISLRSLQWLLLCASLRSRRRTRARCCRCRRTARSRTGPRDARTRRSPSVDASREDLPHSSKRVRTVIAAHQLDHEGKISGQHA